MIAVGYVKKFHRIGLYMQLGFSTYASCLPLFFVFLKQVIYTISDLQRNFNLCAFISSS